VLYIRGHPKDCDDWCGPVVPTLNGGNTNTPAIMIAEKAADMIACDL